MLRKILIVFGLIFANFVSLASAHEAYVLPIDEFRSGLKTPGFNVFAALKDPANVHTFFIIGGAIAIAILLVGMLEYYYGRIGAAVFERGRRYGQPALRVAFGAALFFSALSNSFLGTELSLNALGMAPFLRVALFIASALLIFGFMTEVGALIALAAFAAAVASYGLYLTSYLNYFAEIVALLVFGAGAASVDSWLRAGTRAFDRWKDWEAFLIRAGYGMALIFATVSIKFLHPILPLTVVTQYHLTRFYLLFPHDPLLVVLGAALAEFTIAFFILIGFETRFAVLVSLFYITLSLIFFGEAVWPHLILYGLSAYLLLTPQKFAVDNWLERRR